MIIVGELINASRKPVAEALHIGDSFPVKRLAMEQAAAGAAYVDVNAGIFPDREPEFLAWLVTRVQSVVGIPCCIDSPSAKAVEAALAVHRGTPLINSISLERRRWDALVPLIAGSRVKVVALCMSDDGVPVTAEERSAVAERLVNRLVGQGVKEDDIFIDPLVQPLSTDPRSGRECLRAIRRLSDEFPTLSTICGLSNISYGLPNRRLINRSFAAQGVAAGLTAAILDPLDDDLLDEIAAAEALIGCDAHCAAYLRRHRSGGRPDLGRRRTTDEA